MMVVLSRLVQYLLTTFLYFVIFLGILIVIYYIALNECVVLDPCLHSDFDAVGFIILYWSLLYLFIYREQKSFYIAFDKKKLSKANQTSSPAQTSFFICTGDSGSAGYWPRVRSRPKNLKYWSDNYEQVHIRKPET